MKETEHIMKPFVIYEAAENHGRSFMQHAMQISLALATRQPIKYDFEEEVLQQSLQVSITNILLIFKPNIICNQRN